MRTLAFKRLIARLRRPVKGQVLILFVLLMGFVFLAVLAVGVDIARYHGERRKLQNAVDAAALAGAEMLREDADRGSAGSKASEYITTNTADLLEGTTPANTITVEGETMRVSSEYTFNGIFSQTIGFPTITVRARARAGLRPPDALLPIAIKRYNEGDTSKPIGPPKNSPATRVDHLCQAGAGTITEWPSSPSGYRCSEATLSAPGPVIPLIGKDALADKTSSPGNPYRGWVVPFFNTSASKGTASDYVEKTGGYPVEDLSELPPGGTVLPIFPGLSGGLIMEAVTARYYPGQRGMAMVYDGTVKKVGSDHALTILGYVMIEITSVASDNIHGKVISILTDSPENFKSLKRAALINW